MPSPRSVPPVKLPIGISDFATLVRGGYAFVDKTPFIEEIFDAGAQVTVITRPRRFGKTLNLSMLRHFFASSVGGRPTAGLFEGLAVSQRPRLMAHQGRYPVVFFTLKDVRARSFEGFLETLREMLANLYHHYPELVDSPHVDPSRAEALEALRTGKASPARMANALHLLCELLYKHHGKKVIVLLDEYDTPLHSAFTNGFYPEAIEFMRQLLGPVLKDNLYLEKAVVTGILRIAKENLFSGLNNPKVVTVLDESFAQYFGFTEKEVAGLLEETGLAAALPALEGQIKDWYNGYRFGQETIYNPWSIIGCLDAGGILKPYWVNTSGDEILRKSMARADAGFKLGLEKLIQGGTAAATVDPNLVLADLDGNSIVLWSLLLYSGYLTAEKSVYDDRGRLNCRLRIPNREIGGLYRRYIEDWFSETMSLDGYRSFLSSLTSGDIAQFEQRLRDYLLKSMSYFDATGSEPEKFYHALILGMMVGLDGTHLISSNRESGLGRYDLALFPKDRAAGPGIVLELKQVSDASGLAAGAQAALAQIETRRYDTELRRYPVDQVLAVGLAFAGKEVAVAHRVRAAGAAAVS